MCVSDDDLRKFWNRMELWAIVLDKQLHREYIEVCIIEEVYDAWLGCPSESVEN
jgi:hypothetical protein